MDIRSVTPYNPGLDPQSPHSSEKKTNKEDEDSVRFGPSKHIKVNGYTKTGQVADKTIQTSTLRFEINKNIWDQTYSLLKSYAEKNETLPEFQNGLEQLSDWSQNPDDPIGLNAYFAAHPEDWEKIGLGEIPDYFNVENTGQRILDIWIGTEPPDANVDEWIEEVKSLIGQAYDEISAMFGGLPQLVLDTQAYVYERLDQYAASAQSKPDDSGPSQSAIL